MTVIRFETCDRTRALGFLKKLLPSRVITDTPECAGPILDLVEADVIRIPDPAFHPNGAVFPSKNWTDASEPQAKEAYTQLMRAPYSVEQPQ